MVKKDQENLRQAAYHEAGHAVIGWLYNIGIGKEGIYIDLGRDPVGNCDIKRPKDKTKDEGYLRMLLAGRLSEEKFIKSAGLTFTHFSGGYYDEQKIIMIFDEKYPEEKTHPERFKHYNEIVNHLLDDSNIWEAVEAVVTTLIEERYISKNRLEEIIATKNLIKNR